MDARDVNQRRDGDEREVNTGNGVKPNATAVSNGDYKCNGLMTDGDI